jgi:predicted tellurium resistance membrane protein TerC
MIDQFLDILTLPGFLSLLSLSALEIILGIDNVVVIALVIQHLPKTQREHARRIGLSLALILRILLLISISWVIGLTKPLFDVAAFGLDHAFSGKDTLLVLGGVFLMYKAVMSMHELFSEADEEALRNSKGGLMSTIVQIAFIDLIFSFDSVITAVGVTKNIPIIIVAMSIAMLIMLFFTGFVSDFIMKHPSLKTLALSFVMLIGVLLVGEGFGAHISKTYIYFAMAFSAGVETINILISNKKTKKSRKTKT